MRSVSVTFVIFLYTGDIMEDIQITAILGAVSPAETDPKLITSLGTMTVRFNVLEDYLSTLITTKTGMLLKGPTYDYISKEMMFFQKVKLAGTFIPESIQKRLLELNNNRNKIIHGLYSANGKTGLISLNYRNEVIDDLTEFVNGLNKGISDLSNEIHNIIIYPNKLGGK